MSTIYVVTWDYQSDGIHGRKVFYSDKDLDEWEPDDRWRNIQKAAYVPESHVAEITRERDSLINNVCELGQERDVALEQVVEAKEAVASLMEVTYLSPHQPGYHVKVQDAREKAGRWIKAQEGQG